MDKLTLAELADALRTSAGFLTDAATDLDRLAEVGGAEPATFTEFLLGRALSSLRGEPETLAALVREVERRKGE